MGRKAEILIKKLLNAQLNMGWNQELLLKNQKSQQYKSTVKPLDFHRVLNCIIIQNKFYL